jgi:pilus assembly protein CpaB
MKNTRALVVLVLALLAGLVAVVMAARWMAERTGQSQQLVVASRDVDLGSQLDVTTITTIAWPSGALPAGAFSDPKELEGRVLKSALARGEPILEAKLAPKGSKGGLSAVIGEGKRAITVKVNEVVGVAGFALPGSFVDVMVHTTVDDDKRGKAAPISKIVLERILVLAVAQEASRDDTKPKVVNAVTLEVTPDQAEKIDVARSVGNLSLVLRNQVDSHPTNTAGMGKDDLFAVEKAPPPQAVAPAPPPAPPRRVATVRPKAAEQPSAPRQEGPKVEVIRGVARSTVEL